MRPTLDRRNVSCVNGPIMAHRLLRRTFLQRLALLGGGAATLRLSACADADRARDTTPDTALDTTQDAAAEVDAAEVDAPDATPDEVEADVADARPETCSPTRRDAEGPFYEPDAPTIADLAGGLAGVLIAVSGRVRDEACTPIAGASVEVWQADDAGDYHDDRLRATLAADAAGAWAFDSIMPGRYLQATGLRPAHIHFRVSAPGHRTLVTQLYFEGDPYLQPEDSCGTCGSDDPARIIAMRALEGRSRGVFEITLAKVT